MVSSVPFVFMLSVPYPVHSAVPATECVTLMVVVELAVAVDEIFTSPVRPMVDDVYTQTLCDISSFVTPVVSHMSFDRSLKVANVTNEDDVVPGFGDHLNDIAQASDSQSRENI